MRKYNFFAITILILLSFILVQPAFPSDKDNLIGRWLVNGSLLDEMGTNNGTLTAGASRGFVKTERGLAMEFDGSATQIVSTGYTNPTNFSVSAWVNHNNWSSSDTIIGKRATFDINTVGWSCYSAAGGLYCVFDDGSSNAIIGNTGMTNNQWYHFVVTYEAGVIAKIYVDGVAGSIPTGSLASITTIVSASDFTIGANGDGATFLDGSIQDVKIYNTALTVQQIEDIYNEGSPERIQTKRNFYYPDPADLSGVAGIVGAWSMKAQSGSIYDTSGNGLTGTLVSNPVDTKGLFGRALQFDGVDDYVDLGNSATLNATTDTITISAWVYTDSATDNQPVLSKYNTSPYPFKFTMDFGVRKIDFKINDVTLNSPNGVLTVGEWNYVATTYDKNAGGTDEVKHYVNGIQVGTSDYSISMGTNSDSWDIGFEDNANRYFNGTIDELRFYNRVLSAQEIKDLYNKGANQVSLIEDFSDEGADGISKVPREWQLSTGAYEINEASSADANLSTIKKGTKYLECATAGIIVIQSEQAYGTWEFDLYKGTTATEPIIHFIDSTTGTGNRYSIELNNAERIRLQKDAVNQSYTAASYIANTTWYRFKTVRTAAGIFTFYIRGGAFGDTDWTTIDVSGGAGTNPFTEATYTTSAYMVLDLDAADRVTNILYKKGIEQ